MEGKYYVVFYKGRDEFCTFEDEFNQVLKFIALICSKYQVDSFEVHKEFNDVQD